MKRTLYFLLVMALGANMAMAQQKPQADSTASQDADTAVVVNDDEIVFPRNLIGIRGGLNLSDMIYSYAPINKYYDHFLQPQGMIGIFGHFQLGKSNFAIRPELSFVGRADSLQWLDVRYRLKAHYLDLRLPVTYNFRINGSRWSPYLMLTPQLNMAYGGKVSYFADDYPNGAFADITKADIRGCDASLMFGAGIDYLLETNGRPVLLSFEAGYNIGLRNNFAQREVLDNPRVLADGRSIIGNPFFGAELYRETRKNRGLELAFRVAIPIDDSWKSDKVKHQLADLQALDTIYQNDTIYIYYQDTTVIQKTDTLYVVQPLAQSNGDVEYIHKDCYSFGEMYAFIKLGVDISDKRLCLFNINFDFDSYRLRPESRQPLDEVAMMMKSFPEMRIKIYGHTDSLGADSYNQKLSYNRAKAVKDYLQSKGVNGARMEPVGYGEKYPIDTNSTEQGRFRNRRVEIEVVNVGIRNTDTNDVE